MHNNIHLPLSFSIGELRLKILSHVANGKIDEALNLIFQSMHTLILSGALKRKALFLPELDNLLTSILSSDNCEPKEIITIQKNDITVIIASELYEIGGHSEIIKNIVQEDPSKYLIFLTDIFDRSINSSLISPQKFTEKGINLYAIPSGTIYEKINFLADLLIKINPKAIFHFGHHQDPIGYGAVEISGLKKRSAIFHHCDHEPSIGATMDHAIHCDFTLEVNKFCQKFHNNSLIFPLHSKKPSRIRSCDADDQICFATSGHPKKFIGNNNCIEYLDIVLILLNNFPEANFIHIGGLDNSILDAVDKKLGPKKKSRFINVGPVSSVAETLLNYSATVYISSFPLAGGIATSEAQSIGLPVIFYDSLAEIPLHDFKSYFASEELSWTKLEDLPKTANYALKNYYQLWSNSISHYKNNASKEAMNEAISKIHEKIKAQDS
jgi:hypothetical protein